MTNDTEVHNGGMDSKEETLSNITVPYTSAETTFHLSYLYWIFLCIMLTLIGLCLASCKYLRDQYHKPECKQKRKEKYEEDTRAKEEKAVSSVNPDPIPSYRFLHTLQKKKSDKQLNIEVRAIVRNQEEFSCSTALLPKNAVLNNKQEVVTYDHSRVMLRDMPPHCSSDYINASFIDGYTLTKEYIATQGPTNRTVAAFWHMVWQEGVHCIVMATGLFENAMQQCDKYWDDLLSITKYVRHGDIHIWNDDSVLLAQLNIRTFRIQKEGSSEQRVIKQFEMVGFHDNESTDTGLILEVQRRVSSFTKRTTGPVLVHCRCGGGRTAVFIAVDYCLKQLQAEDRVDVYSCVLHLRRFRKNMVRSLGQYCLIYDTLAMHLLCGCTVFPASVLPSAFHKFYSKDVDPKIHRLEQEYQRWGLAQLKNVRLRWSIVKSIIQWSVTGIMKAVFEVVFSHQWSTMCSSNVVVYAILSVNMHRIVQTLSVGDCASGHRVENRSKSRDIMMLPPERARPYLMTSDSCDSGTDFINAVYIDGFHQENTFLATQWPKKNTINDLWRLLYDYKIKTLVVLNDMKYSRKYPRFWPRELDQEDKYGPIIVKYLGCGKYPELIIRAFVIHKSKVKYTLPTALLSVAAETANFSPVSGNDVRDDELVVKMFQVTSKRSQNHMKSISSKSLLYVMQCAEEWQRKTNPMNPVCVLSKDGCIRTGIYCSICICCDQLKVDNEVDVFNAVRLIKYNRPQLVPTLDEYRYIYQFMAEYVSSKCARPRIIITGAEGQATNYAFEDTRLHDGYSTDDTASPRSSRSGSFDTAIDDQMDSFLPDNSIITAQAKLSACITQLSPHLSPRLFVGRGSVSSTDSLCVFETACETNKCSLALREPLLMTNAQFNMEKNNNLAASKISTGQYYNAKTSLPVLTLKPDLSEYG